MNFISRVVLLVLTFAAMAVMEGNTSTAAKGSFVTLKRGDGSEFRAFIAGPADAKAAVLIVHDYLGISDATKQSVQHLGALGYRSVAVDLFGGKAATRHEEAVKLMQSLDRKATDEILQAGLDYLKQPGRKVATIGFSMGGQESLNANLNDPEAVSATVIIYGSGFDKIDRKRLSNMKEVKRPYEMLIYPGVGHGYAQPLFNEGKNYSPEAVHTTWVLVEDFLERMLKH